MYTSKDDAINIINIARIIFNRDDNFNVRYCAKCGTRLGWYYAENECYLINCSSCNTKTIVQARNPNQALNIVGVMKNEEVGIHSHNAHQ